MSKMTDLVKLLIFVAVCLFLTIRAILINLKTFVIHVFTNEMFKTTFRDHIFIFILVN